MIGPGKERVNLTLRDETISWLRATAPNGKAIGVVIDDLVQSARFQSPMARVENMFGQMMMKLEDLAEPSV